jgi:aspartate carbamoyltransferase catalytic subunit
VSIIVVRHQHSGAAALVAQSVNCSVINAGDGQHEHPSQPGGTRRQRLRRVARHRRDDGRHVALGE